MNSKVKLAELANSLKKNLFATGENSLRNEFYLCAKELVEDLAELEGEGVGDKIAKQIARPRTLWHANLSDKQAWAIAYAVVNALENGKISAENYKEVIFFEEEPKVAKTAEKTAKKATDWKKAKASKDAAKEEEAKKVAELVAICAVGKVVRHCSLGEGVVLENDGATITIDFAGTTKKLGAAFCVGKISE